MGFRIVFQDKNLAEDGHRIYRSTSPMDPNNLPTPLVTLGPDVTSYDDGDVVAGTTYYYRVSAFLNSGAERVSDEFVAEAVEQNDLSHFYAASERGAHYVIADTSTLFQDEAGTVPSAIGDPVRHVKDLSGNGEHLTLSDAAVAPVLQTDGTRFWLQSAAQECHLTATWASYSQPNATVVGFRQERPMETGKGPRIIGRCQLARPFQMSYQTLKTGGGANTRLWADGGSAASVGAGVGVDHVMIAYWNGASSTFDLDGAGETTYADDVGPDGCTGLTLFNDYAPSDDTFSEGRFYGALLIDRNLTTAERSEANSFFSLLVNGA